VKGGEGGLFEKNPVGKHFPLGSRGRAQKVGGDKRRVAGSSCAGDGGGVHMGLKGQGNLMDGGSGKKG